MKTLLLAFLDSAKTLGLSDNNLKIAKEFLDHHEFGLCFDTIITQMYEYDIGIDGEFNELIEKIVVRLKLPIEKYSFMRELIRGDFEIPGAVKLKLSRIIDSLK